MPRADELKKQIEEHEGFAVELIDAAGEIPNANRNIPGENYVVRTDDSVRVTDWQRQFSLLYPGCIAAPLSHDGNRAHGRTLLGTLRG